MPAPGSLPSILKDKGTDQVQPVRQAVIPIAIIAIKMSTEFAYSVLHSLLYADS